LRTEMRVVVVDRLLGTHHAVAARDDQAVHAPPDRTDKSLPHASRCVGLSGVVAERLSDRRVEVQPSPRGSKARRRPSASSAAASGPRNAATSTRGTRSSCRSIFRPLHGMTSRTF
jgi:hypothetical protein